MHRPEPHRIRERTAPRDEAGADNISPTRASRRMPPPDAYGAAGAAGGGYGLRPTMDMGVGEQQPSYTRRSSRDVRDDSLAREAAISGVSCCLLGAVQHAKEPGLSKQA